MASAPFFAACLAYAMAPGKSLPWVCTPITIAVLPALPVASMDSAPAKRSSVDKVDQPLAICGQINPGPPPRLQNFTSLFRQSRSSLLSGVNGVAAMGNSPRKGFPATGGAAAALNFENAAPAATDPSVFNRVLRSISGVCSTMDFTREVRVL